MPPSAPQRSVMDVARPASQAATPAAPQTGEAPPRLTPAPDKPQETPESEKSARKAPERSAPDASKPGAPVGLIMVVVLFMMVLSGLAVVAYVTSQA